MLADSNGGSTDAPTQGRAVVGHCTNGQQDQAIVRVQIHRYLASESCRCHILLVSYMPVCSTGCEEDNVHPSIGVVGVSEG